MEYNKFVPEGWNEVKSCITLENLNTAYKNDEIISGIVKECDLDYNLHIEFGNNIKGIIPRDEIEAVNVEQEGFPKPNICLNKVNKIVQFKVKEITSDDVYILSRKQVGLEALNWVKNDLKVGEIVHGIIKNIRPYGVFVEIGGGIVGLLHIEDISIARIKTPLERFKIGQKIDVMIKCINRDNQKVLLTYKELLGTWEENIIDFEQGEVVEGIVRETEKNKNGVFIELKPNLVGLADYVEGLSYGERVNVNIRKIIPEKRKVKLRIVK